MIPAATREEQACACLQVAETHRENLLAVACRLAGSAEGGMDLFQQTVLNCHDAIQRNGFAGGRYEFYLLASLKNLHFKEQKKAARFTALPAELELSEAEAPGHDARAHLAEQLACEVRERFEPADRVALRLHADGYSCQQISDMTGCGDRTWLWRRLERMKEALRATFQQAFEALGE